MDVRFTPESEHQSHAPPCPLWATSRKSSFAQSVNAECVSYAPDPRWCSLFEFVLDKQINVLAARHSKLRSYRVIRPWLTSTFDELIVYCRTTLLLSKKITSDFLSPSAPLFIRFT